MITVQEYAWLSTVVYKRTDENNLKVETQDGWVRHAYISDRAEDPEYGGAEANHFSGGIYQKGSEIVVAFTGTNTPHGGINEHLYTNLPAGVGVPTAQVREALLLTLEAIKMNGGSVENITFTGHSLGGGLASLMAMFFGKEAVVFDEAPFALSAQRLQALDYYWQVIQEWYSYRGRVYLC